jgi:hypothetical protein
MRMQRSRKRNALKRGLGSSVATSFGFIALLPIPEREKKRGERIAPSPVLAPESALGSRPRVALSSAQVDTEARRIAVSYQGT